MRLSGKIRELPSRQLRGLLTRYVVRLGFVFMSVALTALLPEIKAQDRPATVRPDQRSITVNFTKPEGHPATPAVEERGVPAHIEDHPGVPTVEAAKGQDRIWCGLILATNSEKLKAPDANMAKIAKKIEKFFGYKQIELVGSDTAVDDRFEHWLVPSQDIWLSERSQREPDGLYLLDLRIFHDRRRIIDTKAKLGPDSPLLIRGPMCSRGQLVIAVQIIP
jgi:hypothetical protein